MPSVDSEEIVFVCVLVLMLQLTIAMVVYSAAWHSQFPKTYRWIPLVGLLTTFAIPAHRPDDGSLTRVCRHSSNAIRSYVLRPS